MLQALLEGFLAVWIWPSPLYMVLGILIGLFIGAVPGIGGNFCLAILIPFIFKMEPRVALSFLLGAHAIVATGGSITAVLLNTPGDSLNAATTIDGFPMTQKGQGARALGAALTASMLGGVFGAAVLGLSLPIVREIVLIFGPPEFFMMTILGISFIALVGQGSIFKSLVVGFLGLLMSLIGYDPITGVVRFNFGTLYLFDGIKLIPIVMGMFAIAEMIDLSIKGGSIQRTSDGNKKESGVLQGVKDVFKNWWLVIRCSAIGSFIGMVPGLGGTIACFVAYGHAAQTSKNASRFGLGEVEGVIAPESANNAKEGGSLIPTLGFGIPGSSGMAILLGAFIIIGIIPGPDMLTKNLSLTFQMVWIVAIANILGALLALLSANKIASIAQIRGSLIIPVIIIITLVGSYVVDLSFEGLIVTIVFGIIGYQMKKFGFSRAVLIIGFVLGGIAERNYHLAKVLYGKTFIFNRPIALIIFILTLLTLSIPFVGSRSKKKVERNINAK